MIPRRPVPRARRLTSTAVSPLALAGDLGGTTVEAALVDGTGTVLPSSRARRQSGGSPASDALADAVRSVMTEALGARSAGGALLGVGIGCAGPISALGGFVSTGIGGGIVLKGATVSGATGNAGHIGHIEVAGFGDPCACGHRLRGGHRLRAEDGGLGEG